MNSFGKIQSLTFYQENYLTEEKPGVWINKHAAITENLKFAIKIDDAEIDLENKNHEVVTDVMADFLPRVIHKFNDFEITLIPFYPIFKGKRYSMVVYKELIQNKTKYELRF